MPGRLVYDQVMAPRRALHLGCSVVLVAVGFLALKMFLGQAAGELWNVFDFGAWGLAGVPFYTLWAIALVMYRYVHPELAISFLPVRSSWTRTNVAVGAAICALASIEVVQRLRTGIYYQSPSSVGYLVAAVVLAPIVEESLFRGVLWARIHDLMPGRATAVVAATVVTSILFAWWHVENVFHPLDTQRPLLGHFEFGVALAILRWRFNAIGVGIVLHAIYNAGGVFTTT